MPWILYCVEQMIGQGIDTIWNLKIDENLSWAT